MPDTDQALEIASAWDGQAVSITVISSVDVPPGWHLVVTCSMPLTSPTADVARVIERQGSYHVIEPASPLPLIAGRPWSVPDLVPMFPLRHANDGPVSAYVAPATGPILPARVLPTVATGDTPAPPTAPGVAAAPSGFPGDPALSWRGLHIDLARQWIPPETVEWLIDVAAERRLNRLHLHLTDDEGWRLPVAGYPQLADAATRGHGLPLPPMLGTGPDPNGRLYEPEEIGRWVERAEAASIVLVPEADMPAHMHAALAALPHLRDPADSSGAISVQGFVDNVLVPGHPPTTEFVTAVIDALAGLFPTSPWIHIGGDEVPDCAWAGSPAAAAYARERGLEGTEAIAASFTRDLVELVRGRTGRRVGAWQEAAEGGGLSPDDGYVVAWRTAGAARELAAAGFDVVLSPGSAYYFDMAMDDAWESRGASWAGTVTVERVADFEPGRGWSKDERIHLLGVQACLWTEHVHDRATLEHLLLSRLDAFAERAWTNRAPAVVAVE